MVIFHSSVSLPEGNNIHDMFSESPKESFPVRPKDEFIPAVGVKDLND